MPTWSKRTLLSAVVISCLCPGSASAADFGDSRNLDTAHTNTHFSAAPYQNLSEWRNRRETLRKQILVATGLWPLQPRPTVAATFSKPLQRENFRVETVTFETLPGFRLHGNIFRPTREQPRMPAVLVPQGHWKHGRIHHEPEYSVPELCAHLARQGYVVFAWDMVGYNESDQLPHSFGHSPKEQLWAFSPLSVQLWNSLRALDFLSSQPGVDPQRIAVTGASGGGIQTILLAAVDDRIAVSAPVDMVSASFQGDDDCEIHPGLRIGTNNVEISALMAPKPLLLVSSTKDWTKHTPVLELPMAEAVYQLYGATSLIQNAHIDAKHNYNRESREAVYRFFHQHLRRDELPAHSLAEEHSLIDFDPRLLLAAEPPVEHPSNYEQVFAAWRQTRAATAKSLPADELRALIRAQIGASWPDQVDVVRAGPEILLQRAGSGDRVPAKWSPPSGGQVSIVVDSRGMKHALAVKSPLPSGWGALHIDVFQTGSALTARPPRRDDHLTFHRSDDANRVQDILTAISFVANTNPSLIQLECDAHARGWCLAAAAISPVPVKTIAEAGPASPPNLFIPGLELAGGVASLRRLANDPTRSAAALTQSPPPHKLSGSL